MFETQKPSWDSTDAKTLREFLDSELFRRALSHVMELAPDLLDGGDVNKTLVASGKRQGYELAFTNLFNLCHQQPEQSPAPEAYPSLDDETKWQDNPVNS